MFNCLKGIEERNLAEGMHPLVPLVEAPVQYDVRTQTYTMSATHNEGDQEGDDSITALSADGQTVKIDISVRYNLVPSEVWQLHKQVGPHYLEKIVRPEAQTDVRNCIANYTVTELYSTTRQSIQEKIREQMAKGLSKYHITLDELLIRNIAFSDAFASAIEQKQVALQEAERMKYVLQKEESEKQRKIIAATGEAEAIRRRGLALKDNPMLIQYEYVQKLSPNITAVVADQKTILNVGEFLKTR